jgi:hypothetical protein
MAKKRKIDDDKSPALSITPPPFSPDTLRHRLLTGTMVQSGGQKGSLTRCVQKFALFCQGSEEESDDDKNDINKGREDLIQELTLYRMELTRLVLLQQTLEKESKENSKSESELEQQTQDLSAQVQVSYQKADRARQVQSCFMEYEALAKLANDMFLGKTPSSSRELQKEIEKIKHDTVEYEKEEVKLNQTLEVRASQFQLLMQCMLDLKRSLSDDEGEEQEATEKLTKVCDSKTSGMEVDNETGEDGDGLYGDL